MDLSYDEKVSYKTFFFFIQHLFLKLYCLFLMLNQRHEKVENMQEESNVLLHGC